MSEKPWNPNYAGVNIFEAFLYLSRDGVYILGEDGGFLEVNPAYCNTLGYSRKELLTLSLPDIETKTSPEAIFRRITASKASGAALFETAHRRKDGSMVDVEITATHIKGKDTGLFLSIVRDLTRRRLEEAEKTRLVTLEQSVIDITERKKKDAAMRHLNRLKDGLISATRIISGKLTLEDTLRETLSTARRLSEAKYAVLAFVENGIVTKFFHEGLDPETLQTIGKWLDARGRMLLYKEKAIVRVSRDSHDPRFASFWDQFPEMHVLIRAPVVYGDQILATIWLANKIDENPFTDNDQEIIGTLAAHAAVSFNNVRLREQIHEFNKDLEKTVQERTRDLKEAMSQVKMASDAKSRFLSGMSHELRTPMNAIIGFSDVLADEYVGPLNDKQREYVGDILDSANRLLLLIDDILDVSRIESGKMMLDPEVVRISELLEDSLIMVRENANKHAIAIRIEMAAETAEPEIIADPKKLKQVFFNLLFNAVKFTPDGGSVVIKTGLSGPDSKTLRVIVEDTGIGITPEHLEKIFEDYFQVQDGIQDKTQGTGLGLSLVKRLVAMHGGRAWAESSGIGKGSRFVVELPVNVY